MARWRSVATEGVPDRNPSNAVIRGLGGWTRRRNRALVGSFGSKTLRNQASSKHTIWGASLFVRHLIQPPEGHGLAYLDFSGQEYVIAAYSSCDQAMVDDCTSGDPYLGFGKRVGIVPKHATKQTHKDIRNRLKVCCGLGCIYGAGPETIARSGRSTVADAKYYLAKHKLFYRDFWEWRQCVVHHASMNDEMRTPLGGRFYVDGNVKSTTASNWPMQSAGADMLRLATCTVSEAGIRVVGVLHDALLIESPLGRLDDDVANQGTHGRRKPGCSRQRIRSSRRRRVSLPRAFRGRTRDGNVGAYQPVTGGSGITNTHWRVDPTGVPSRVGTTGVPTSRDTRRAHIIFLFLFYYSYSISSLLLFLR